MRYRRSSTSPCRAEPVSNPSQSCTFAVAHRLAPKNLRTVRRRSFPAAVACVERRSRVVAHFDRNVTERLRRCSRTVCEQAAAMCEEHQCDWVTMGVEAERVLSACSFSWRCTHTFERVLGGTRKSSRPRTLTDIEHTSALRSELRSTCASLREVHARRVDRERDDVRLTAHHHGVPWRCRRTWCGRKSWCPWRSKGCRSGMSSAMALTPVTPGTTVVLRSVLHPCERLPSSRSRRRRFHRPPRAPHTRARSSSSWSTSALSP